MQGSTVAEEVIKQIQTASEGKKVMVALDSAHGSQHVAQEMEAYCPLVSVGSYCIVEVRADMRGVTWEECSDCLSNPSQSKYVFRMIPSVQYPLEIPWLVH